MPISPLDIDGADGGGYEPELPEGLSGLSIAGGSFLFLPFRFRVLMVRIQLLFHLIGFQLGGGISNIDVARLLVVRTNFLGHYHPDAYNSRFQVIIFVTPSFENSTIKISLEHRFVRMGQALFLGKMYMGRGISRCRRDARTCASPARPYEGLRSSLLDLAGGNQEHGHYCRFHDTNNYLRRTTLGRDTHRC